MSKKVSQTKPSWPYGLLTGVFFLITAAIDWSVIRQIHFGEVKDVFDLMTTLFMACWALAWSAGVLFLGVITLALLFGSNSAKVDLGKPVWIAKPKNLIALPESPTSFTIADPFPSIALIGANLVPLFGVLFLGWDLGAIMVLFRAESAVIGFYYVLKIFVVGRVAALFTAPFFIGHFGAFMTGHFTFIYYLFIRRMGTLGPPEESLLTVLSHIFTPLWPALLALVISHGISFGVNFIGKKEYVGQKMETMVDQPYRRVLVMHLTILFGGWLVMLFRSSVPALTLLILLKIWMDLNAHKQQRKLS